MKSKSSSSTSSPSQNPINNPILIKDDDDDAEGAAPISSSPSPPPSQPPPNRHLPPIDHFIPLIDETLSSLLQHIDAFTLHDAHEKTLMLEQLTGIANLQSEMSDRSHTKVAALASIQEQVSSLASLQSLADLQTNIQALRASVYASANDIHNFN